MSDTGGPGLGQTRPVTVRKLSTNHSDILSKFESGQRRPSLYETNTSRRTSQSSLLNGSASSQASAAPSASTSGTSTPIGGSGRATGIEKPYEIAEKLRMAGSTPSTTGITAVTERRRASLSSTGKPKILRTKAEKDAALEQKVINWIESVINERPTKDYENFIQDGSVLSRVMTSIVFNSVPIEDIGIQWGSNPAYTRVTALVREIRRYGVVDVFEPADLLEKRNIPKVTKCLAQLSKLAASDKDNLLNSL